MKIEYRNLYTQFKLSTLNRQPIIPKKIDCGLKNGNKVITGSDISIKVREKNKV